jgi:hypothetical protein
MPFIKSGKSVAFTATGANLSFSNRSNTQVADLQVVFGVPPTAVTHNIHLAPGEQNQPLGVTDQRCSIKNNGPGDVDVV